MGNRALHFDHDYASEIVKKLKEYNEIKKALKERGIRFQTPYTRMRIHWDSGARTYDSAQEARRDLRKQDFQIEDPVATEGDSSLEKQLAERLGWKLAANARERSSTTAQREREKLLGFQRKQAEESGAGS